jgi:chromosome partitioning protein
MTQEHIIEFLKANPSLSLKSLDREAGIPEGTLSRAMTGKRNLNQDHIDKLEPILQKYGFVMTLPSRVTCIVNLKGGVAKTTTTANLGACLAALGLKVLLVDFDPQGNLSSHFGFGFANQNIYHALKGSIALPIEHVKDNLDLVPADIELSKGLDEFNDLDSKFFLQQVLKSVRSKYDYILVDVGPGQGALLTNALVATDDVIIPVEPEAFTYKGIDMLLDTINATRKRVNKGLKVRGILFTRFDARLSVHKVYVEEIRDHYSFMHIFEQVIPLNTAIKEAQRFEQDILEYKPESNVAQEYMSLAKTLSEVVKKEEIYG